MTKGQQSFLGDGYVHYLNHGGVPDEPYQHAAVVEPVEDVVHRI